MLPDLPCPPEVRRQLGRLAAGLQGILGDDLLGLYLHGSLAMGCFNPARSDLDLLALTGAPASLPQRRSLAELLLAASLQPAPVEISLLRRAYLLEWQHPTLFDFHYSETWRGQYLLALRDGSWQGWAEAPAADGDLAAHLAVTRARGVCLYGLPIAGAIPPIPEADFLASVLGDVLDAQFGLPSVTASPVYVVLNACRTLAYLRSRRVLSKREGGEWALENLPAAFLPVVAAALAAYAAGAGAPLPPPALPDTSGFRAYMLAQFAAASQ